MDSFTYLLYIPFTALMRFSFVVTRLDLRLHYPPYTHQGWENIRWICQK